MADTYQWTTVTFEWEFEEGAFDNYQEIIWTIKMGKEKLEKVLNDTTDDLALNENTIICNLSQEETALLKREFSMQVNVYYTNGIRKCSDIETYEFEKNLHEEVIE